ncbi:Protein kinase domain [Trypanosoma melophagium]|uniref:Protein kinase domain n=1 Tax=Trypanosoma melophagium TaxID=715481 RepID=UPI00351A1ECA|nr:Protein kinase domain [Trypanosoma melophagium]
MILHPILATPDDEEYVQQSIISLQGFVEKFFEVLESVYLEGKQEQIPLARTVYQNIQSTLKVLGTVPASSYRRNAPGFVADEELPKLLGRMGNLFLDDVVGIGPNALTWKKPVTRLAQDVARHAQEARIKFPLLASFIRSGISYDSVLFAVSIVIYIVVLLWAIVALTVVPMVGPPPFVASLVGSIAAFFLIIISMTILFHFIVAAKSLQELYTCLLEERMNKPNLNSLFDKNKDNTNGITRKRLERGRDTKRGYYTILYGDDLGYIDGRYVDTQVVMIGFDDKFLITRWNTAAEVMTGFLESGCIGKPLSELVDTPNGDVSHDLSLLKTSREDVMKVKLRAFATAPVTLFTIVAPILNPVGKPIGNILICANVKDNLREFRSYVRDYITSEVNLSLSLLVEKRLVRDDGYTAIDSLKSFLTCASEKQVEELAREMDTEWEWTTADQLLGHAMKSSREQHIKYVDPLFPSTLCLHPNVPNTIAAVLNIMGDSCTVKLQISNTIGSIFALSVKIIPSNEKHTKIFLKDTNLQSLIMPNLRRTCGNMYDEGNAIYLRFPCHVTLALEDIDDAAISAFQARSEQSLIDQTRAIVNCTVNVLTLITNLVDQHNISMNLLRTMFVSLTSVRDKRELEKRLETSPNDIDVVVCDHGWLSSVRDLILSSGISVIVVPIAEAGVPLVSGFQYVINTPISSVDIRRTLMDIGTVVSLRKNANTAREERERILTLRQDSPWTKGKLLGRGSFGAVYEATSDLTGGKMAVKMFYFSPDNEESINKLLNEIKIMCSLNHPNIVHYFHCERKENNVNLFMELCDASLADIIIGRTAKPPTVTVVQILRQILTAITYLHTRGVAHRDVKPPNILLKGDIVKITDFGTARQGKTSKDVQGTLRYMAPEVYRGEAHSSSCDIWSIGCLACELFACPLKFMNNSTLLADITSIDQYLDNATESVALQDFLRKCFQLDPEKRPTAADLLLHPIFSPICSAEVESLPTIFAKDGKREDFAFSISSQRE